MKRIESKSIQYGLNQEATKISALSSGDVDKYEYLTVKYILPSQLNRNIEKVKITYSPLKKAFEKQVKKRARRKIFKIKSLKLLKSLIFFNDKFIDNVFPSDITTGLTKSKLHEIKAIQNIIETIISVIQHLNLLILGCRWCL